MTCNRYEKNGYMGEDSIKKDKQSGGRVRNMENKN